MHSFRSTSFSLATSCYKKGAYGNAVFAGFRAKRLLRCSPVVVAGTQKSERATPECESRLCGVVSLTCDSCLHQFRPPLCRFVGSVVEFVKGHELLQRVDSIWVVDDNPSAEPFHAGPPKAHALRCSAPRSPSRFWGAVGANPPGIIASESGRLPISRSDHGNVYIS